MGNTYQCKVRDHAQHIARLIYLEMPVIRVAEGWRGVEKVNCLATIGVCKLAGAELLGAVRRRDNTMLARWASLILAWY